MYLYVTYDAKTHVYARREHFAIILDWDQDCYEALFEGTIADEKNMRGTLTH